MKFFLLSAKTSSSTNSSSFPFGISIEIISPSSTSAIVPPSAASGEICPIAAPLVAPLNLPSVISATYLSKPIPAIADVGDSISLIPGPPFGPSYLITTTSPLTIFLERIASIASSSKSNTLAGPLWTNISSNTADFLTTAPSSAKFPLNTLIPPVELNGSSIFLIIL